MTPAQWRELIEAYVSGRLSADAFKRRFNEAFAAAVAARAPTPPCMQELAYTVESYAGDPTARGHDVTDDEDLMRAARRALSMLPQVAGPTVPHPDMDQTPAMPAEEVEAARARMRGAAISFGAVGLAGCLIAALWLAIAVMQFFAIAAEVQAVLKLGPAPSTLLAIPLAFIPLVGSVIAFFGARDVWHWEPWLAAVVFLAIPVASMLGGGGVMRARFQSGNGGLR